MPPERPATKTEIIIAVGVLFRQMRLPKGVTADERTEGYVTALDGMPLSAIEGAIAKFLRDEVPGFEKNEYCPRPPTLARVARDVMKAAIPAKEKPKAYAYPPPRSAIIERNVTKAWAWQLIENGVHPRGSIWCPGALNEQPEYGDLYAPDPTWTGPKPIAAFAGGTEHPDRFETARIMADRVIVNDPEARAYVQRLQQLNQGYNPLAIAELMRERAAETGRQVPEAAYALEAFAGRRGTVKEPKDTSRRRSHAPDARAEALSGSRKVPDYSKDKLTISPALATQLAEKARLKALLAESEGTEFSTPKKRRRER